MDARVSYGSMNFGSQPVGGGQVVDGGGGVKDAVGLAVMVGLAISVLLPTGVLVLRLGRVGKAVGGRLVAGILVGAAAGISPPSAIAKENAPRMMAMEMMLSRRPDPICRKVPIKLSVLLFSSQILEWQDNAERGAAVHFGFHPDAPALGFRQCFGDGQANAGIAHALDEHVISPVQA
jgi:hypothetical protein